MYTDPYPIIMIALAALIGLLTLLLVTLERTPRKRHTAVGQQSELNRLSQGRRERDAVNDNRADRKGQARRPAS